MPTLYPTSWTNLVAAVADELDRDDMTNGRIETMIRMAELRIYRNLRLAFMETAFSDTIASGVVAVPSGFLEWRVVWLDGSPVQYLQPKPLEFIRAAYPMRSADSRPKFIAPDAGNFEFGPYPDTTYTVKGTYYKQLDALSDSNESNWLITDAFDVLLYGALVYSATYLGDDGRLPIWNGIYTQLEADLKRADNRKRFPRGGTVAAVPA